MNAIAIQGPRLPYHPAVEERFGIDQGAWRVLTDAVFPAAEKPESVIMALAYCKARNLDIFKKPVQIVPIYDKKRGGMVDTVWPGIAELRTTAMRTGSFAGFEDTDYGPMIEEKLGGVDVRYPEWAQCTVYRLVAGQKVAFVGPKTFWIETYATAKRDTKAPNSMWAKRPRGQLEKCAEAAALRRAFPEEIGNEYAAEEMEGQAYGAVRDITAAKPEPRRLHAGFEPEALAAPDISDDPASPSEPSETPASETRETSDAGDQFPGDVALPADAGEGEAADPSEPNGDEEKGSTVDLVAWADKLIDDLPFFTPEQFGEFSQDRRELGRFAILKVQNLAKAKELEKAIDAAREASK